MWGAFSTVPRVSPSFPIWLEKATSPEEKGLWSRLLSGLNRPRHFQDLRPFSLSYEVVSLSYWSACSGNVPSALESLLSSGADSVVSSEPVLFCCRTTSSSFFFLGAGPLSFSVSSRRRIRPPGHGLSLASPEHLLFRARRLASRLFPGRTTAVCSALAGRTLVTEWETVLP